MIHRIPTQFVTRTVYEVAKRLIEASHGAWVELGTLPGEPLDDAETAALEALIRAGYVDRMALQGGALKGAPVASPVGFDLDERSYVPGGRFFNAPAETSQWADVAMLGLPVSSNSATAGCRLGPAWLRGVTRPIDPFSMFKEGLCSEMFTDDGRPEILCQGLVVGDLGDVIPDGLLLRDYFAAITEKVRFMVQHRMGGLFLGGDHAVTIPLVKAYLESFQDLQVVCLDAHSDLFYSNGARFHHASAIRSILDAGVRGVRVLGLHSFLDQRAANLAALPEGTFGPEGLVLRTLSQTREMLQSGVFLDRLGLDPSRPVYVSIDLDVLSDLATGGMVSTPMGHGLEWVELFEIVRRLFRGHRVVGCDIVECDPTRRVSGGQEQGFLAAMALIVHELGAARGRVWKEA
jgi:arginase family enzyme